MIGHMDTIEHYIRKLLIGEINIKVMPRNIAKRAYSLAACIAILYMVKFL